MAGSTKGLKLHTVNERNRRLTRYLCTLTPRQLSAWVTRRLERARRESE